MALGRPTKAGTSYTSQRFGPANPNSSGYYYQPAMYGLSDTVAYWQPYKGWFLYPHYHNGLDEAGGAGTPLTALETGRVVYSAWKNNGGGYVITVEIRPGTYYHFNHCQKLPIAKVGNIVKKGQVIAYMGNTGATTGNHVHVSLEIKEKGPDGATRSLLWNPELFMAGGAYANDSRIKSAYTTTTPVEPAKKYVKFNSGVNGVNIRNKPDSRPGKSSVFAVAYKDPRGIERTADVPKKKIGNTSSRRTLYGVVKGADGYDYNKLWIYGTTAYTYVQSRFMHPV